MYLIANFDPKPFAVCIYAKHIPLPNLPYANPLGRYPTRTPAHAGHSHDSLRPGGGEGMLRMPCFAYLPTTSMGVVGRWGYAMHADSTACYA